MRQILIQFGINRFLDKEALNYETLGSFEEFMLSFADFQKWNFTNMTKNVNQIWP